MGADLDHVSFALCDGVGIWGAEDPNCAYIGSPRKLANGFFSGGPLNRKSENDRINTGDFWWAWVDLNHRPRPYQGNTVKFCNDLQEPRGLPKYP